MNQEKFLKELEHLLSDISDVEREEAMEYYRCYFEDAGPENEAGVLKELGSPQKVADMIKAGLQDSGETGEYTETGYHIGEKKDTPAGPDFQKDRDIEKNYKKADKRLEKNKQKAHRQVEKNNKKAERKLQKNNRKAEQKLEKSNRKVKNKKIKSDKKAEKKLEKDNRRKKKKQERAEKQVYRQEQSRYENSNRSWKEDILFFPWMIIDIVMFCVMIAVIVALAVLAAVIGGACIFTFITGFVMLGFAVAALVSGLGLTGVALLAVTLFVLAAGILLLAVMVLYCSKVMPEGIRKISGVSGYIRRKINREEI